MRSRRFPAHGHAVRSRPERPPRRFEAAGALDGRAEEGREAKAARQERSRKPPDEPPSEIDGMFPPASEGAKAPARRTPEFAPIARRKAGQGPKVRFEPPIRANMTGVLDQPKAVGKGFSGAKFQKNLFRRTCRRSGEFSRGRWNMAKTGRFATRMFSTRRIRARRIRAKRGFSGGRYFRLSMIAAIRGRFAKDAFR